MSWTCAPPQIRCVASDNLSWSAVSGGCYLPNRSATDKHYAYTDFGKTQPENPATAAAGEEGAQRAEIYHHGDSFLPCGVPRDRRNQVPAVLHHDQRGPATDAPDDGDERAGAGRTLGAGINRCRFRCRGPG